MVQLQRLFWIVIERHFFDRGLVEEWGTQLGSPPPADLSQERFEKTTGLYVRKLINIICFICFPWVNLLPFFKLTWAQQRSMPVWKLSQPRRATLLLLSRVRYFCHEYKRLNVMTRGPFCWDHMWPWTGGFVCAYCRSKHTSKTLPRRELEGNDLRRKLTRDEWDNIRDIDKLK